MIPIPSDGKGRLEMTVNPGGCTIALPQASTAQKSGAAIKIVFGAADVRRF
jgi:hypothetical protein